MASRKHLLKLAMELQGVDTLMSTDDLLELAQSTSPSELGTLSCFCVHAKS